MYTSTDTVASTETPAETCYAAALAFADMLGDLPGDSASGDTALAYALEDLATAITTLQGAALLTLARNGQLTIGGARA
jgi:hypothetical protein